MGNSLSILSKRNFENILWPVTSGDRLMTLAEFLKREEDAMGLVALAEKIGIAHTSLRKLTNGDYKRDIETFIRVADAYKMPLWKVMEMAGYDLGLSEDRTAVQVASLVRAIPEYAPVLERLASLDPRDLQAIVLHLTALLDAQSRLSAHGSE